MKNEQKFFQFYFLTLAICFANCLAIVSVKAEPLQGQVNLSEELQPLPPSLRKGAKFDPANLPAQGIIQNWICIPYWRAGTFHRETQTLLSIVGPITVPIRSLNDRQIGHQIDNRGQIWHHYALPEVRTVEAPHWVEWQIVTDIQTLSNTQNEITNIQRGITLDVDKKKQKIIRVGMSEQLQHLTPGP